MRRGLVHTAAWLLATGAAVTLSWWGVHTVMAGTAYDPPRAVPIAAGAVDARASSTHRPESSSPPASPSHSASRKPSRSPGPATPSASRTPRPSTSAKPPASPSASGTVKGYTTQGGRAVFDLGKDSATLVSATPAAGWSVQVWKDSTWIRVEFTSGTDKVSVFCTWHDHAPSVEVAKY
ncbi:MULTISPECIES: hypothetical protein [unclassified Streptomyces]|uniref:hypothetical protein n=1 Tax=unclassified Streptomyces TaxID=2593676 RepID=UPI002252F816|nr:MULTISPECIES: hypothetical protein [unclassified Streptomyces]MCX5437512.1 hypothetical protein [Streptomyces sp. NBC_00063]WSE15198.1 hypothetical protein OG518_18645 [Streptomyces sp. NBC_01397]WUB95883.1 hypothetical protein OHO83_28315 [Streptomyces sp. NBC_00569]